MRGEIQGLLGEAVLSRMIAAAAERKAGRVVASISFAVKPALALPAASPKASAKAAALGELRRASKSGCGERVFLSNGTSRSRSAQTKKW